MSWYERYADELSKIYTQVYVTEYEVISAKKDKRTYKDVDEVWINTSNKEVIIIKGSKKYRVKDVDAVVFSTASDIGKYTTLSEGIMEDNYLKLSSPDLKINVSVNKKYGEVEVSFST